MEAKKSVCKGLLSKSVCLKFNFRGRGKFKKLAFDKTGLYKVMTSKSFLNLLILNVVTYTIILNFPDALTDSFPTDGVFEIIDTAISSYLAQAGELEGGR